MADQLTAEAIAALIRGRQSSPLDVLIPRQQEAKSVDPTLRQSLYDSLQNAVQDRGASPNFSKAIADTALGQHIGLADLVPGLNAAIYADQGMREFQEGDDSRRAGRTGDAYLHGLRGGLGFLPAIVTAKAIITSPLVGALGRHIDALKASLGGGVKP